MSRRLFLSVIALILVLAGGAGIALFWQSANRADAGGAALIGGPFSLVDQRGERVTEKNFEGAFMIAYFGYTYCPDFCPLGLSTITEALEMLDEGEAAAVTPVFFSVDPARDTVERLADYAESFHPRLVALTGTDDEIAAAARAYRIYYNIPEHEGDDYPVDHSTFTYLMGPDGAYRAHFSHDVPPEDLAERLRAELKKG